MRRRSYRTSGCGRHRDPVENIESWSSIFRPTRNVPVAWGDLGKTASMAMGSQCSRLTLVTYAVSIDGVIRSFGDSDTQKIWELRCPKGISAQLAKAARRKMQILDAAENVNDLRVPPANRLEKLQPPRDGQHSIRVNDQYWICFTWSDGGADDVELTGYH